MTWSYVRIALIIELTFDIYLAYTAIPNHVCLSVSSSGAIHTPALPHLGCVPAAT